MAKFSQGQMIVLKSNRSVEGAVIAVLEGSSETRYQVFTNSLGMQTYYESQIEAKELEDQQKRWMERGLMQVLPLL